MRRCWITTRTHEMWDPWTRMQSMLVQVSQIRRQSFISEIRSTDNPTFGAGNDN
jgi:hypothetical protein